VLFSFVYPLQECNQILHLFLFLELWYTIITKSTTNPAIIVQLCNVCSIFTDFTSGKLLRKNNIRIIPSEYK
jgi:hypothetical protein